MSIDLTTVRIQVQVIHGGYGRKLSPAVCVSGWPELSRCTGQAGWGVHWTWTSNIEHTLRSSGAGRSLEADALKVLRSSYSHPRSKMPRLGLVDNTLKTCYFLTYTESTCGAAEDRLRSVRCVSCCPFRSLTAKRSNSLGSLHAGLFPPLVLGNKRTRHTNLFAQSMAHSGASLQLLLRLAVPHVFDPTSQKL